MASACCTACRWDSPNRPRRARARSCGHQHCAATPPRPASATCRSYRSRTTSGASIASSLDDAWPTPGRDVGSVLDGRGPRSDEDGGDTMAELWRWARVALPLLLLLGL